MIEQLLSVAAAAVLFGGAVLRLNVLKASRPSLTVWSVLEVLGLAGIMGGTAGLIGQWFLPRAELHAEVITLVGVAIVAIALRMQGWVPSPTRVPWPSSLLDDLEHRLARRR